MVFFHVFGKTGLNRVKPNNYGFCRVWGWRPTWDEEIKTCLKPCSPLSLGATMPGRGVCRKHVSGCGLKPVPRTKNHKARLLRFGAWTNLWWKPQVPIYLGKYLPAPLKYFFFGGLERLNPHPAKVVDCWEAWSWLSLRHFKISR